VLVAGPVVAQIQQQKPPAQQTPPAQKPPEQKPAAAPRPFPEGSRYAIVDVQKIANESKEGQVASKKVQDLQQKKVNEIQEKNKTLEANRTKLSTSGGVMSEEARNALSKEVERQQVELQRLQQDAQAEVQDFTNNVQMDFQRKLMPVIEAYCLEKNLLLLFGADAGFVWADSGLDVTVEVIKRFDAAAGKPPSPPKPPGDVPAPRL
jgi:Skp family chaperone for outer membrane proteins